MERGGCVYILTNTNHTVLYIGVTSDLYNRVNDHKNKKYINSFTAKYNCTKLIYYQMFSTIEDAIGEEKRMKKWNRAWKIELIQEHNPNWLDLYNEDL